MHVFMDEDLKPLLRLESAVDVYFTGPMKSIGPVLSQFSLDYFDCHCGLCWCWIVVVKQVHDEEGDYKSQKAFGDLKRTHRTTPSIMVLLSTS